MGQTQLFVRCRLVRRVYIIDANLQNGESGMRLVSLLLSATALLMAGCLSATDGDTDAGSDDGQHQLPDDDNPPRPDPNYQQELVWEPCAHFTGGQDSDAECAQVEVPADWRDPSTIFRFARQRRYRKRPPHLPSPRTHLPSHQSWPAAMSKPSCVRPLYCRNRL